MCAGIQDTGRNTSSPLSASSVLNTYNKSAVAMQISCALETYTPAMARSPCMLAMPLSTECSCGRESKHGQPYSEDMLLPASEWAAIRWVGMSDFTLSSLVQMLRRCSTSNA